jgi:hypothetical protein
VRTYQSAALLLQ